MKDYAKVSPQFWTRGSGKRLRGDPDAQVLAMYLVTCPFANMIGIYYAPFVAIAHETGLGPKQTALAMSRLESAGFATYDHEAEVVWVPNMASYQLGEEMSLRDNRHRGVLAEIQRVSGHRFVDLFLERYGTAYNLPLTMKGRSSSPPPLGSPLEAPPKDLRSPLEAPPKPLPSPSEGFSVASGSDQYQIRSISDHIQPEAESEHIVGEPDEELSEVRLKPTADIGPSQVWERYVATRKRVRPRMTKASLGDKDRAKIKKLLRGEYTLETLLDAAEGLFLSEYHLENDFLTLEYALRDGNIEKFAALAIAARPSPPKPEPDTPPEGFVPIDDFLAVEARFAS